MSPKPAMMEKSNKVGIVQAWKRKAILGWAFGISPTAAASGENTKAEIRYTHTLKYAIVALLSAAFIFLVRITVRA